MLSYGRPADFRDEAVAQTDALLAATGLSDPAQASFSTVSRIYEVEHVRRRIKQFVAGTLAVVIALFCACALLFTRNPFSLLVTRSYPPYLLGSVLFALTCVLMMSANFIGRIPARRAILGRLQLSLLQRSHARWVSIEDPATVTKIKFVTEDIGLLFLADGSIRIEGLSHRYFIRQADVVELVAQRGTSTGGTKLTFRVGTKELSLAMVDQGVFDEFRRLYAGQNPMLMRLRKSLRQPVV